MEVSYIVLQLIQKTLIYEQEKEKAIDFTNVNKDGVVEVFEPCRKKLKLSHFSLIIHGSHATSSFKSRCIKETMHQSQILAEGCGQDYALRIYDLTTAKIARRIHFEEAPIFDNLFIFLGSFHTEMSFFSSLGRMLEWSGGPYVLSESDNVSVGSMNKFNPLIASVALM